MTVVSALTHDLTRSGLIPALELGLNDDLLPLVASTLSGALIGFLVSGLRDRFRTVVLATFLPGFVFWCLEIPAALRNGGPGACALSLFLVIPTSLLVCPLTIPLGLLIAWFHDQN